MGSDNGRLYAIESDGTEKWRFPDKDENGIEIKIGSVISSPTVGSDGVVYVGSDDGHLYAVKSDGTQKWKFPDEDENDIGSVKSSPAIGSDGIIYIGASNGNLYIIYPSTGEQKGIVSIGDSTSSQDDTTPASSPVITPDKIVYIGSNSDNGKLLAINCDSEGLYGSSGGYSWPMFHHDICHTGLNSVLKTPEADAGPDQTVEDGDTVTLDGSGSTDSDYKIVTYKWTSLSGGVTLSDTSAVNPTFTAPNVDNDDNDDDEEQSFKFKLTVTDSHGFTDTDECTIKVEEDNAWCFIAASAYKSQEEYFSFWYIILFVCAVCVFRGHMQKTAKITTRTTKYTKNTKYTKFFE